jgi:rubrerythrin
MVGEAIAGLGAIKTAFDLAKGLKEINDAANRNAAVIELQEKILTAQQAQAALVERVNELEEEVASFEAWDAEKQRYKLTDYGGGTFAYALKPEAAQGEPAHRICPACYQKRDVSILQFGFRTSGGQDKYNCPSCKTEYDFGQRQASQRISRTLRSDYF